LNIINGIQYGEKRGRGFGLAPDSKPKLYTNSIKDTLR